MAAARRSRRPGESRRAARRADRRAGPRPTAPRPADADAARHDRVDQLDTIRDAADLVTQLLGTSAGDLVAHWYPADLPALLDDDPELVDALLHWWADRDDPNLVDQAHQALTDRHATAWTRQAQPLLDAAHHHGDHPRLRAAAATLAVGRLLDGHVIDQLGQPPVRTWSQIQQAALQDYQARRDDQAAAVLARLGWLARRHTSPTQLGDDHDHEHLLACDTCAIAYPRPDPTGPDWYAGEHCPHCHAGTPMPYERRGQVPALDDRLAAIRARLTAGGKATLPPPRPPAG
ncbi:hypothetical protein OOK41_13950 [Micromonospora sp. NBC_01655]|uniref:hypothetical protein n=1 Tax=Micromonospora sp. NBC_01655 TaxID=2975983 RepID=UPI002252953F|nr:hypothetical protein [Micromonospora sp. NBC_01655]MCX4471398.1 hypothetical protein [Micromonospora sp. NBC_01655]